ncbi:uncharacterized protein LOC113310015 [Papaver somniferum]|uniref:uncharacterized protein LOC113310015 n=1 Tax=Papaver somniferum TaxID=3469 RepID=UPI000E704A47|nr:uncharacterized protein LOC113310015 [Papaver somniferum]
MIDAGKLLEYVKKDLGKSSGQFSTTHVINFSHARIHSMTRRASEDETRRNLRKLKEWYVTNHIDFVSGNGAEILELGCTKIEFSEAYMRGVYAPHNDDIVITSWIRMFHVHRILVDTGRSVSVLFSGAHSSMNLSHELIEEDENPITKAIGKVKMPITVAEKSVLGNFLLLGCRAPYNTIVGRDWLHAIGAITSSYHQCLNFITPEGVAKSPLPPESYKGEDVAEPPTVEKLIEVQIGDEKHKPTFIGENIPAHERDGLITLLKANVDVFTWSFAEMLGMDPIACHRLNIDEKFHPVRQKVRNMAQRKKDGVAAEVEKLLEAGFIRPVQYPRWMSNVVPVPKKNGKIRICIDFTDLNKACPSDPYPLPRIRDLVDAPSGCGRQSFMDGFSGYNQIPLFEEDQEYTAFVTDRGVYCYTVMPLG